jgi:hypothetical protein
LRYGVPLLAIAAAHTPQESEMLLAHFLVDWEMIRSEKQAAE